MIIEHKKEISEIFIRFFSEYFKQANEIDNRIIFETDNETFFKNKFIEINLNEFKFESDIDTVNNADKFFSIKAMEWIRDLAKKMDSKKYFTEKIILLKNVNDVAKPIQNYLYEKYPNRLFAVKHRN